MTPTTPIESTAEPTVPAKVRGEEYKTVSDAELSSAMADILFQERLLDRLELAYIQQKQLLTGETLWNVLIREGLGGEAQVVGILSRLQNIPFVHASALELPTPSSLALFNKEICLAENFIPLKLEGKELLVLLGNARPQNVQQTVLRRVGMNCKFIRTEFSKVTQLIRNSYYFARHPAEALTAREIEKIAKDVDHVYSPEHLLSYLLHWAVRDRSTDIHMAPGPSGLHVLFRIDGVLQPVVALPPLLSRLIGYIKLTADMDISEQRRPQDGSFRISVLDSPVTVRVSTIVTEFGERMVMRLLPESHDIRDLASLDFFEEDLQVISQVIAAPVGLVLITGPTGSGKSSTLHAGLRMQQLIARNILTVEDPLEYRVPVAGQTEVNRKGGYDFSTALRHFLRHDPDVILVGEMRDPETAQAAVDAAATGHLVLSTLHVTSVFGVVPRLRPMGIDPQLLAENLKLVINQRLARKVCSFCQTEKPFTASERHWLRVGPEALGRYGVGCERCRHTGYLGRIPIYEMLLIDEQLANIIADDAGREAIRKYALEKGFESIVEVAKKRVILGQTTCEEVLRVVGEGPQGAKHGEL